MAGQAAVAVAAGAGGQGSQPGQQQGAGQGKQGTGEHDKGIPSLSPLPTYHIEQSKGSMAGMGMGYPTSQAGQPGDAGRWWRPRR
jgi:hypothetical protein